MTISKRSTIFPVTFEDKLSDLPESERDGFGRVLSGARADELKNNPIDGSFDGEFLSKIHKYLFQDVSTHAGIVCGYSMSKGDISFAEPHQIGYLLDKELPLRVEMLGLYINEKNKYINALTDLHSTLDLAHPFRDGNGRSSRLFLSQLAKQQGYDLDFSKVERDEWIKACVDSVLSGREDLKRPLFERITQL